MNPVEFVFDGSWSEFITEWEKPWNDFILYVSFFLVPCTFSKFIYHQATVLLAVNLSYLAVPNVIPNGDMLAVTGGISRTTLAASTGVLACLCSIITSIGCIILGLLLVNEHHSDPKTEDEVGILL